MSDLQTCRICHDSNYELQNHKYGMVRYSVRSSVHYECGLKRWGRDFFAKLRVDQLEKIPFMAAQDAGLLDDLRHEIECRRSIGHPAKHLNNSLVPILEPR